MEMQLYADRFLSPIGGLCVVVDRDGALVRVAFLTTTEERVQLGAALRAAGVRWEEARCADARAQIEEYFRGARRRFALSLRPEGTEFQRRVWEALREIPYGATISYGELAARVGMPKASRAVGQANNKNPIPVVVPCHRVIGADGRLVGYRGGVAIKGRLLDFERARAGFVEAPVGHGGQGLPLFVT
jgi:methylated-DNA-[protein]-cysteine S-methyltransferase